ncbi:MAG: glycosyl hydrolase family 18 protein [Halanaerobiaceae bacterium]
MKLYELFFKTHKRIILVILLVFLLLPSLLILTAPTVYSAGLDWTKNNPWLKGILLLLVSFIINNFAEKNNSDEPINIENDENNPIIIENDFVSTEKEVLGFHVNWLTPEANSYQSLRENWRNINMVAPFWYTLNPDGEIVTRYGGYQYEVDSYAKNHNIEVLPLINNNQENNMILVDPATRKKAVNNVVELVKKYDFAGVNIDFEFIPPWTRNGYTSFVEDLSIKLRKIDKKITISVFPKIDVPVDLNGAYDYAALAPLVDRMVIMTYDNHWSRGPAGPIASIGWVEKNIKYALEYLPSSKILLGIANYGYNWSGGFGQDLSAKEAIQLASEKGVEVKWHDIHQTPYFTYQENDEKHEVWFENSSSLDFKLDLVNKYNLKGIGIWRLGNETEKFWETIENKLK